MIYYPELVFALPEHVFEAGLIGQAAGVNRAAGREVGGQAQEHLRRPEPRGPGVRGIRIPDPAIVVDLGAEQVDRAQAADHPKAEVPAEASSWTKVSLASGTNPMKLLQVRIADEIYKFTKKLIQ